MSKDLEFAAVTGSDASGQSGGESTAQASALSAKPFGGHTELCECTSPTAGDCYACEHGCNDCGIEPDSYLDDNGRCDDCAQKAVEDAMARADDRAKDFRKYGE